MSPLVIIAAAVGFGAGFCSALFAAWWGFRRGIEVKHPELLKKKSPPGQVELASFDPIAR